MDRPPALDAQLVQQFVIAAHRDLDEVERMLAAEPGLLNATWDWGGGDFETALGGAAHTGQRAIALYLLQQGARPDLFAAAMLGWLDFVKAVLAAYPEARQARGAHGIPLAVHAQVGGEAAADVLAFLTS